MSFYSNDILKQFQSIHQETPSERKYRYHVSASGESETRPAGTILGNNYVITANVRIRIASSDAGRGVMEDHTTPLPCEYSKQVHNSVVRRSYRPVHRNEVTLDKHKYCYRQPNFTSICDRLVKQFNLPPDTVFDFTQASYRRDGSYHNRIVSITATLTQESERLYHIDKMLDLLE